jgi:hypothetical protein
LSETGRDRLDLRVSHAVGGEVEGFNAEGSSDTAQRGQAGLLVLNQLDDKGSRRLDEISGNAREGGAVGTDAVEHREAVDLSISSAIHNLLDFLCELAEHRDHIAPFVGESRPCTGFAQRLGNGGGLLCHWSAGDTPA